MLQFSVYLPHRHICVLLMMRIGNNNVAHHMQIIASHM
jgi:hypothetical protein